jgi:hypothetical protein
MLRLKHRGGHVSKARAVCFDAPLRGRSMARKGPRAPGQPRYRTPRPQGPTRLHAHQCSSSSPSSAYFDRNARARRPGREPRANAMQCAPTTPQADRLQLPRQLRHLPVRWLDLRPDRPSKPQYGLDGRLRALGQEAVADAYQPYAYKNAVKAARRAYGREWISLPVGAQDDVLEYCAGDLDFARHSDYGGMYTHGGPRGLVSPSDVTTRGAMIFNERSASPRSSTARRGRSSWARPRAINALWISGLATVRPVDGDQRPAALGVRRGGTTSVAGTRAASTCCSATARRFVKADDGPEGPCPPSTQSSGEIIDGDA